MKNLIISLKKQKTFSLKAEGSSMTPLLRPNDVLYYKKTTFNQCRINDLIMAQKRGQLFTHRIIYKTNNYLVTKGDNNTQSDGKIYPKQIIAKAYQIKRNGEVFDLANLYLLRSTLYFQEIIKIKKAFEVKKIDFVFLKGLPLHLYFEKAHPQRIYFDCDVLIDKKDFKKAEEVLTGHGYKKSDTSLSKTQKQLKDKEIEGVYYKKINGFPVVFDLHVEVAFMMTQLGKLDALYPQRLIDKLTKDFLREKQEVTIQGSSFYLLSSISLIIYLALHFFHHNFRGAFRLEFLDKIICKKSLNVQSFNRLYTIIKRYHLQNFVYPVFVLLKKYYQTPIPNRFLKLIQPSNFLTLKLYDFKNLNIFDDEPRIKAGIHRFKNLFFLSPNPLWKKVLVFINLQVIYMGCWILYKYFFRKKRKR
jgi:signal peptidase I